MLLIDDRAGSKDLMKHEPVRTLGELTRLDSADVALTGNGPDGTVLVGVEVKSLMDLVSSANTGRLQATQIPAMLNTYDVNWLLYFGIYRVGADSSVHMFRGGRWRPMRIGNRQVPYGYIEGLLFDLTELGVHVRHVSDIREAAVWLGALSRWWSKPWSKHHGMRVLDKSRSVSLMPGMSPKTLQLTKVAAALPAVGFERAIAAAQHFGSVSQMINATADEWAQVPGIGKVVAKSIVEAVK